MQLIGSGKPFFGLAAAFCDILRRVYCLIKTHFWLLPPVEDH
jgi:hypothetical protein